MVILPHALNVDLPAITAANCARRPDRSWGCTSCPIGNRGYRGVSMQRRRLRSVAKEGVNQRRGQWSWRKASEIGEYQFGGNDAASRGFRKQKEDTDMADSKSKRGGADRSRVAAGEGYEVNYFARKHGITSDQARDIIHKVGNNREKLNAAAEKLKGK